MNIADVSVQGKPEINFMILQFDACELKAHCATPGPIALCLLVYVAVFLNKVLKENQKTKENRL